MLTADAVVEGVVSMNWKLHITVIVAIILFCSLVLLFSLFGMVRFEWACKTFLVFSILGIGFHVVLRAAIYIIEKE